MAGSKKSKLGRGKERASATGKNEISKQAVRASSPLRNGSELVEHVKPVWREISLEDRRRLLTVNYEDVLAAAKAADARSKLTTQERLDGDELGTNLYESIFVGGMERKRSRGMWKRWRWTADAESFTSQVAFQVFLDSTIFPPHLLKHLPRGKMPTGGLRAEAALRKRLADLVKEAHEALRVFDQQVTKGSPKLVPLAKSVYKRTRPTPDKILEARKQEHIKIIARVMAGVGREHEPLYSLISVPLTLFLCESLPERERQTRGDGEIAIEDLQGLPCSDVLRVSDWLIDKVHALAAQGNVLPGA